MKVGPCLFACNYLFYQRDKSILIVAFWKGKGDRAGFHFVSVICQKKGEKMVFHRSATSCKPEIVSDLILYHTVIGKVREYC